MWLLVRLVPLGARQIEDGGKVLKIRKKRIVSGIEQPWYFSFYFTSFYPEIEFLSNLIILYSMKIKEQTRKLAVGCSKHCFEVVDRTDEVSNHTYGKVKLTWFEEIFEEYKMILLLILYHMERE